MNDSQFPESARANAHPAVDPAADTLAAAHVASSIVAASTTIDKCALTTACISGTNTSTGAGVFGTSANGRGVSGSTKHNSTGPSDAMSGIYGADLSVSGTYNAGVWGVSTRGDGVHGTSTNQTGVVGQGGKAGVSGTGNFGLFGLSVAANGYGVYGQADSSTGTGVEGGSFGGIGTLGVGNPGLEGQSTVNPLVLTNESTTVAYVDSGGNLYIHGTVHNFADVNGVGTVTTSSPASIRPAIEDTGTAHLVNGQALVQLDANLVRALDATHTYQVFLTPGGDTRGLYVARKSASSFTVREVQGGRGTFDFDYHVYGTALSTAASHTTLPKVRSLLAPQLPN